MHKEDPLKLFTIELRFFDGVIRNFMLGIKVLCNIWESDVRQNLWKESETGNHKGGWLKTPR